MCVRYIGPTVYVPCTHYVVKNCALDRTTRPREWEYMTHIHVLYCTRILHNLHTHPEWVNSSLMVGWLPSIYQSSIYKFTEVVG